MSSTRSVVRNALLASPAGRFLLKEPRFTIVSTGRSGTRYTARVLTESGIKTGHEDWWNPYGRRVTTRLVGEASWCAVFNLAEYRGHVFHQIRDPLRVVSSLATTELDPSWEFEDNELFYEWRRRNIDLAGDPVLDAMNVVVRWTRESERCAEWTYRVEDFGEATIREIAERADIRVEQSKLRAALREVPTSANSRRHSALRWDDLPEGSAKTDLLSIATAHGYE